MFLPTEFPQDGLLTGHMAGLGMSIEARPVMNANIEDTLMAMSLLGMEHFDFRILGLLVSWMDLHSARINVDRLTRAAPLLEGSRTRAFWGVTASRYAHDRRWRRLAALLAPKKPIPLLSAGTDFQMSRRGEDQRFAGTNLQVPSGTLRERDGEIMTSNMLVSNHRGYAMRVCIGPSYRADAWAALSVDPGLTTTMLARKTYTSFATAWQVQRDYMLFHEQTRSSG